MSEVRVIRDDRPAVPASPGVPGGYDRVPPHNLDAETSVLGSMLLSKAAIAEVTEIVGPEDFYRGAHRTIFEAILHLYDRGEPVDTVTLTDELERRGTLDDVGGVPAVAELVSRVPTAANALYYARIVSDHAVRRRLIDAGTTITRLGYEPTEDVDQAVDTAEAVVYQVAQRGYSSEFTSMKDLLAASFELIERLHESDSTITGLSTGFADLDDLTAGLQPGNLVILAARPAMGKSTLVTNVATHVAVVQRRPAVLFSLEMSKMELVQRILAAEGRVESERLRTGRLQESDWPKLSQAMGRLAEAPLFIDDTPGINLMEIRSKARRLKQKHGLDLVVVDYLQLMHSHRRVENRVQEVSEFSRGLKVLAKELDIPVLALSQLSRKPEDRTDRRPQLADLRESGCLTGDTLIARADTGEEVRIGDLFTRGERDVPVWTVNADYHLEVGIMTHAFYSGVKEVFRLSLESGRVIDASANHPFLTPDGWRRLDELARGHLLAVPGCLSPAAERAPRLVGATMAPAGGGYAPWIPSGSMLPTTPSGEPGGQEGSFREAADLQWDAVAAIESRGQEPVFDATVPGTHNFIANNVIVHNSIEQDADLVCFIYRDEVYNPDTEAKGEAELIVAKHRNGPLRNIRLSFLGHQSRFANMARNAAPPTRL